MDVAAGASSILSDRVCPDISSPEFVPWLFCSVLSGSADSRNLQWPALGAVAGRLRRPALCG